VSDTVTLDQLPNYGLTLDEVRRWPTVTEYTDPNTSEPYYLLADLIAAGLVFDCGE
jgi:hypothetical protein